MGNKFANNGTLSPEKRLAQRRHDAKKFYGLTLEQADSLRTEACDICEKRAKKMCIDHVINGSYRGVLCQQCNTRLGWFEAKRIKILQYLESSGKR